jgi:hypothetical protein
VREGRGAGVTVGFGALCVLQGSLWLLDAYFASAWPDLLRLCIHDLEVGLVLGCALLVLWPAPGSWKRVAEGAGWCAALFALPWTLSAAAGGSVAGFTQVLALGLVPLFTVVLVAQSEDGARRLQLPAVLAVGGLALSAPFELPATQPGIGWLLALVVGAGVLAAAGIRLHRLLQETSWLWVAASGSVAAGLLGGLAWRVLAYQPIPWSGRAIAMELGWGLLVDGPLLLLTVWLLRAMRPLGFSARFVVVPLVTIAGGLVLMPPRVGWLGCAGLTMATGAGLWMMGESLRGERDSTVG